MTQGYPLQWPDGLPRTERKVASAFKTSLSGALGNVHESLRLFGRDTGKAISNIVVSSNVTLGSNTPADPGIAVWFIWDGEQRCIAVDRYPKPQDNLQAIHHILEARRTEMRHGGLHIVRQTFKGFLALPSSSRRGWRDVLGLPDGKVTREMISEAFKARAKVCHPDLPGGSHEAMSELTVAHHQAIEAL